jgi:5-methylcytosine-specific restriction protein A
MRRSLTTNTLVIISTHVGDNIYEDRWLDGSFHYTGMGRNGDQRIDRTQNRTLVESNTNGVGVYLFEVFTEQQYTFIGQVKLIDNPYQEIQADEAGNDRNVYVFPLALANNSIPIIPQSILTNLAIKKNRKAKRMTDNDLIKRTQSCRKQPGTRRTETTQYDRNPAIAEYAKRRSNGICQLCQQPAPFLRADGTPYLEAHHIIWLAKGGGDTNENTVALCPNCHRKMHIVDDDSDKLLLLEVNKESL